MRPAGAPREVVACVLSHEGRYLLLRRSVQVANDQGRWHCVTGYCEDGVDPLEQAVREVFEETGLSRSVVHLVNRPGPLQLLGDDGTWTVHPFHFTCTTSQVRLNWEHDDAVWLGSAPPHDLDTVSWLKAVLSSLGKLTGPALWA